MALARIQSIVNSQPASSISLPATQALTSLEIGSIKEDLVAQVQERVAGEFVMDPDSIRAIASLLQYEGFDPSVVYRHFLWIAQKGNIGWELVRDDLTMILVVHHIKGNVSSANMRSFKAEAQNLVASLFTKWRIVLKTTVDKRNAVTLPRIGAAFPFQLAQVAASIKRDFSGFCDSASLPDCMKSGSFGSLVPRASKCTALLLYACTSFSVDQTATITKANVISMTEQDKRAAWLAQYKFTEISFNSSVADEEHRRYAINHFNLGTPDIYRALLKTLTWAPTTTFCSEAEYVAELATFAVAKVTVDAKIAARTQPQTTGAGPI
uniref:Nucleocapsid protein n=1 Tax=Lentinula edodes negative-strand RNA virus 3 TaxID=2778987 RepID=A0A7S6Z330_9VIRU|nr:nucleocapsid protein [Lentinula edodes negative-strand RNA virus 3]